MSISRIGVLIASLVCSVESTRCPVSAARRPICAVSSSRISPTRMMSGSWRRAARSTRAKVSSIFSLIWTWLMPGRRYSTGSSTVMIFFSTVLSSASAAYSVVVLPLPVGPVTSTMALVRRMIWRKRASISAGMPTWSRPSSPVFWFSSRSTADSPCCVGMVDMRTSTGWSRTITAKRPSCGRRFSEISSAAMSFRRSTIAGPVLTSVSVCGSSTPSMRKRIWTLDSCGSMCTSEAFTCTASSNTDCNSFTTGASSAPRPAPRAPKSM